MVVTYRFVKTTKNYRRYSAVDTPPGFILGDIYAPLDFAAETFTVTVGV